VPRILAIRALRIGAAAAVATVSVSAYAAVEMTGLDGELRANVEAYLTIDELECDADRDEVRREFRAMEDQVGQALSAFGYYRPQIRTALALDDACWTATISVELGPRVRVRTFEFSIRGADDDPRFRAVAASPGIAVGDGLHHGRYEALKRRLQDLARDRGYPEARLVENRIDVYPMEDAADIALRFDTGPRYRFGDVRLEQNALADDFIESYILIEPGTPFDNAALTATWMELTDSGYFETIDVRALEPDPEARTIPVRVTLVGSPRLLIDYGAGFSTDTGPRVRIGRHIRRFNDRGSQLGVQLQLSPVVSEVTVNYRYPYGDPRYEWVSFDAGIKREDTETATSRSVELGARRIYERPSGWTRTQFVDLLVEDFDVAGQAGRSRLLMPGIDWMQIIADDSLRPERGVRLDLELRGAADSLGSDTDFLQLVVKYKWIRSFGNRGRVLARGDLGATGVGQFDKLPPSVRFFAGGDNSVRGYDFESLGPADSEGRIIGGSRLLVASVEYEHRVKPKWSVAAFVDAGNAFSGSQIDVKRGAGIGARWQSPLGPVRLDVAFPLDDPTRTARIHINLGPDL
jgi:translocation and assembly module TamA